MNSRYANVTCSSGQGPAFEGKQFACPLCYQALPLKPSKKGKPYCTCDDCGIQIFFRGKTAIERLERLFSEEVSLDSSDAADTDAIQARLDALVLEKLELEEELGDRQDPTLEDRIARLEAQIEELL